MDRFVTDPTHHIIEEDLMIQFYFDFPCIIKMINKKNSNEINFKIKFELFEKLMKL